MTTTSCSDIFQIAEVARLREVPIIAGNGILDAANIVKAISLGASAVVIDAMEAHSTSQDRYFTSDDAIKVQAQCVTITMCDRGTRHKFLPYLIRGIQHGFQDIGVRSLNELQ